MREVIYLRVSKRKVEGMTKSLPNLYRGEIPVKLTVEVKDAAFREPVIERTVVVDDWSEGIDIEDVQFEKSIITEEEAQIVKQRRLEKMAQILGSHGYKVEKETEDEA